MDEDQEVVSPENEPEPLEDEAQEPLSDELEEEPLEEEEAQGPLEDTQEAATEPERLPIPNLPAGVSEEQLEAIADTFGMTPQQASLLTGLMTQIAARQQQAASIANQHVFANQQQYPDWYARYGANVQYELSQMNPQLAASADGVNAAQLAVIHREASQNGDLAGTLRRHADLMSRTTVARTQAATPARPAGQPTLRRSQVAPSAGLSGSGPRGAAPSDRVVNDTLKKLFPGIEEGEIAQVKTDRRVTGRR